MNAISTILLFTKDEILHQLLQKEASAHSMEVVCFEKNTDALIYLCEKSVHACVMGAMVPDFYLLHEIRFIRKALPLLVVSPNMPDEEKEKVYNLSCDTYTKSIIDEKDIFIRLSGMIRQAEIKNGADTVKLLSRDVMKVGQSSIDFRKRQLHINDKSMNITQKQVDLLELFCLNKGGLLTKEIIVKEIWNTERDMSESLLVYIHRLRKLFKEDPSIEIQNVHGLGYVFVEKLIF